MLMLTINILIMNKIQDSNFKYILLNINKFIQQSTLMDESIKTIDLTSTIITIIVISHIIGTISFRLIIVSHLNKHLTPPLEKTFISVPALNFMVKFLYLLAAWIFGCSCSRFEWQFFNLYDEYYFMVILFTYFCSDIAYFT